jgi:ribonuclease Z
MPSHNLSHIKMGDIEIVGYSVAGEETVVGIPQLGVCFDIGKSPEQIISISNLLLTHGHMDHAAGIAYYLSHRKFSGQSPGTVLAPANLFGPISEIIDAWGRLDGNRIPANFVPMSPGDEYQLKPNLFARAFATKHSKGSLGFTIIEKKKKLKEEYLGLTSNEIVALKKKSTTIDYTVESPIVTYLGDTQYSDFSKFEFVAKSKILIAECTFVVDEHVERALAGAHMHVDEFVKMMKGLDNEHIIITHLSQRTHIGQAKKILKEKLGAELYSRVLMLMDRKYRQFQA